VVRRIIRPESPRRGRQEIVRFALVCVASSRGEWANTHRQNVPVDDTRRDTVAMRWRLSRLLRSVINSPLRVTVHGQEAQDTAIRDDFPPLAPLSTPPHNVANLSQFVMARSFAATLRGGETRQITVSRPSARERLPDELPVTSSDFNSLDKPQSK
jgi:hypothetical protein